MFGKSSNNTLGQENKSRPSKSPIRSNPSSEMCWTDNRLNLQHSQQSAGQLPRQMHGPQNMQSSQLRQLAPAHQSKMRSAATRVLLNQLMDLIENRLSTKLAALESRSSRNAKTVRQLQAAFSKSEREVFTISALFRSKDSTTSQANGGSRDLITEDIRGFFNLVKGQLGFSTANNRNLQIPENPLLMGTKESEDTNMYDEEEDQEISRSRSFTREQEPYREVLRDIITENRPIVNQPRQSKNTSKPAKEVDRTPRSRSQNKPPVPTYPRSPKPLVSTQKQQSRPSGAQPPSKTPQKNLQQTRASKSPSPVPSQPKRVPTARLASKNEESYVVHGKNDSRVSTSTKANSSAVLSTHNMSKQSGLRGVSNAVNTTLNISLSLDQSRQQDWSGMLEQRRRGNHLPLQTQHSQGVHNESLLNNQTLDLSPVHPPRRSITECPQEDEMVMEEAAPQSSPNSDSVGTNSRNGQRSARFLGPQGIEELLHETESVNEYYDNQPQRAQFVRVNASSFQQVNSCHKQAENSSRQLVSEEDLRFFQGVSSSKLASGTVARTANLGGSKDQNLSQKHQPPTVSPLNLPKAAASQLARAMGPMVPTGPDYSSGQNRGEENSFGGDFRVHNKSFGDEYGEQQEDDDVFGEGAFDRITQLRDIPEETTESESRGPTTRRTPRQFDANKEEMLLVETERLLRENNLLKRFEEESARTSERLARPTHSSDDKLAQEVEMEKNEITKMLEEALMSVDPKELDQVRTVGAKDELDLGTTQDLTREVENIFKKYSLKEGSQQDLGSLGAKPQTEKKSSILANQENVAPLQSGKRRGIEEVRCSLFQEQQQQQLAPKGRDLGQAMCKQPSQQFPNTDFGDLEIKPKPPAHKVPPFETIHMVQSGVWGHFQMSDESIVRCPTIGLGRTLATIQPENPQFCLGLLHSPVKVLDLVNL